MAGWLSAVDVLLYPSIADTAPLAVMEALSCGVPVVAFRLGGLPDQVRDGETGFLCEPSDARALAQGVARLLEDAALLQRFRDEARNDAAGRFDIALSSAAYLDLYRACAADFFGGELPANFQPPEVSASEWVRLQNGMLQAKEKMKQLRAGRKREREQVRKLLGLPWIKAGMSLRLLPREIRKWAEKTMRDAD